MANFVEEARQRREAARRAQREKATGAVDAPKSLPKGPQIMGPPRPTASQRALAAQQETSRLARRRRREAVDKERAAAAAARSRADRAARAKNRATPKAKAEPEFITKRVRGGSIRIRNPRFKRKK